jgi:3-phenylpropionate/trans-cinnamate dioxygenase ferredoxin subunit
VAGDGRPVGVGDLSDLPDGDMRACRADGVDVVVCRVAGALYALEDLCSHADTTLSDGLLSGYVITCPLHGAQFDVRDGSHLGPPAWTGVASFPVTEGPDGAVVELPAPKEKRSGDGTPGGYFRTR